MVRIQYVAVVLNVTIIMFSIRATLRNESFSEIKGLLLLLLL